MAMTAQELEEFAEEVIVEVLELVDDTEKKNNSFFKRVPRYEVGYLIHTIRELSTTVLNLSKTATVSDRLIKSKDDEIDALDRKNLELVIKVNQLEAKLGD